jgi:arylsulfatase A-like enzyme
VPKRPNLLFIFTDQQRADTLGCYGNSLVQTPVLDALARESFVFENAYVTQPVCTPSRASILTGLYPHTHGLTDNNVPLRPETKTIAEMVSESYVRGYCGKWHLGDEVIAQHGFEDWVSVEDMYRKYYTKEEYLSVLSTYHDFLVDNGLEPDVEQYGAHIFRRETEARLPEPFTKARFVGREAARFLHQNRNQPFILYVNFLEPHTPYCGPFDDLYPPDQVPVGPHFRQEPAENAALQKHLLADRYRTMDDFDGEDLRTEAGWRKTRAKYLGNVTLVDRAIGDILRALDESGQRDNTVVVFTSDHGDMMGDHGLLRKAVMYEEALKVPLIVRVPWMAEQSRRVAGRISQINLIPTLLDLLGQEIPRHLEGVSLTPALEGKATLSQAGQDDVIVEWNGTSWKTGRLFRENPMQEEVWQQVSGPWRTVIGQDGWKLNLSPTDRCELHDLNNDPHEQLNLYEDLAQRDRILCMTERLRQWQVRTGDTAPIPDGTLSATRQRAKEGK